MQDRKQELETLIDRYLKGQLDAEEKRRMEQWMHELDVTIEHPSTALRDKELLKARIDARLRPTADEPTVKKFPRQSLVIAASLLLFVFAGSQFLQQKNTIPRGAQLLHIKTLSADMPKEQSIRNNSARDTSITLLDGSQVRLTANSTLKWKVPFEAFSRAVELEGKAFFEVAHDSRRPFSVLSADIITTALGTSFWVEQARVGAKPRVRLITGKVSIAQLQSNGQQQLLAYLAPGQQWQEARALKISTIPPTSTKTATEEEPIVSMLFFHHKPLTEVLPALASFYRTKIIFSASELEGMSFYGSYDQLDNITQILTTICIANDLEMDYNEQKKTYTIRTIN